ncbi:MAG: ATP-binding protein [Nitrososphaerota archaeon]|nr:ATP-binding protein [Nitrososphaerota archaeon]
MSSTADNNKQEVRVRLSSKIMDELMDRAYSSAYDPFRELVSNAYDANASFVRIERMGKGIYTITDDGKGIADFNRFLTKGISSKATTKASAAAPTTSRKTIGEKGLGFLSVFKISNLVEVCSSSNGRTFRVRLTSDLIRESIDTGSAIEVEEEEGVNSQRGTLIRLWGVSKIISSGRLHAYLSTAFAPLLSENQFDVFVCGRKCFPPSLPDGTRYSNNENSYTAVLIDPFRVEDRTPVRFYNGGVIVKSEIIPKRPTITGFVNTDLTLVTGRGGYVEDASYRKFRKDFDSFVETIPQQQYPGDSSVFQERRLQNSLDRISKVLNSSTGFKIPSASSLPPSVARSDKPAAKVRIIARTFSGRHEQTSRSGPELKEEALSPEDYPVIGSQGNLIIFNVSHPLISKILEMKDDRELILLELASHAFADLLQMKSIEEHRQASDRVLREMLRVWPQS